ncbi:MAG: hypothetical protein JXO44_12670 [Clostridia bacterium]|nr:hypothetical protein [Clostridia bacterium]
MAKKNIFEKLGLIEAEYVEDDAQNEEMMTMPDITMQDPVIANLAKDTDELNDDEVKEIEGKLDVLIGAYEKNKLLTIEDIYRNARVETDTKKTIFMADIFLKALPENLPVDVKKESLLNIMNVSNIPVDTLLSDAYQRIDALNTVLENTVQTTQSVIESNEASIRELERRVVELKKVIDERRKFEEDQNTLIEYEVQKIIGIVDYIKQ